VLAEAWDGSGWSIEPTPSPPGAPTHVSATATDGQAVVSWTAPSDGSGLLTGYVITPTPDTIGPIDVNDGSATSWIINGLQDGTSYTFTVQAENNGGVGPVSAPSNSVAPSYATAVSNGISMNNATATTSGGSCLDFVSKCFSIQQNFYVGQDGADSYWVQNVIFVQTDPSGNWEAAGAYQVEDASSGEVVACNAPIVDNRCVWTYSGMTWYSISFPQDFALVSSISSGQLTLKNSFGTSFTWPSTPGSINSILDPHSFVAPSVKYVPELVLVGEENSETAHFAWVQIIRSSLVCRRVALFNP
jgi:hypothetical protein